MEVGRLKAVATICLVFWMIVGQSSAASKCYKECYSLCLPRLHDPLMCQLRCDVQCSGGSPSHTLVHSCESSCASKFCGDQKLGTFLALSLFSGKCVFMLLLKKIKSIK